MSSDEFVEFSWLVRQIKIIESEYLDLDINSDKNDNLFAIISEINKLLKKIEKLEEPEELEQIPKSITDLSLKGKLKVAR